MPTSMQRLIFRSTQLEDHRTLESYEVQQEATLTLPTDTPLRQRSPAASRQRHGIRRFAAHGLELYYRGAPRRVILRRSECIRPSATGDGR